LKFDHFALGFCQKSGDFVIVKTFQARTGELNNNNSMTASNLLLKTKEDSLS
jgi:hypothetical protein